MKKICFITAARSEYGLLKWIIKAIGNSKVFERQLVVTGAHLLEEQGHTIDYIIQDGFPIDEIVDCQLDLTSVESIAASMGRMGESLAHVFRKLMPDYVVVLGDRYELLPIVNTAFVMRIPIIHFSGGDVTEGAIDNGIRNAVTMLSDYHFPGTDESADNIIRMRGSGKNVWTVGEPGLDSFNRETLLSRSEIADSLGLNLDSKWILFTFHAETMKTLNYNLEVARCCIETLMGINGIQTVATFSNADYGGNRINEYLQKVAEQRPDRIKAIPSLGQLRYLSFMRQVSFVIGNSSSGIVEAPSLGVPVINIGDRQKGRHQCSNIIQADSELESIRQAIEKALFLKRCDSDYYWGDGHTAEKVVTILEKEIG